MTLAPTIGVMRWLSADSRTSASWPTLTCEMSFGFTCASMMRSAPIGRSPRITAPGETTPPGVWKFLFTTMPRTGERTSTRSTTSWAGRICSSTASRTASGSPRHCLAQLLDRIAERRRVELGYSFVRLSDPLLRIGDAAEILAELSPETRLGASQRQHIRLADQLLAKKRILVLQLFGEQGNTMFGGLHLRLISANAFLQPGDLLREYAFLGRETSPACQQLGTLPLQNRFDFRITCALAQCRSFDCR